MHPEFIDCAECGKPKREETVINGKCPGCYALKNDMGVTVELPRKTVEKLIGLATTRHPTACNETAHHLKDLLEKEVEEL